MNDINKKMVVVSANLESNYSFNLPMVCLAWRRLNIEPIVFIVTSNSSKINKSGNKTIEYLKLFNIKIVNVESPKNYELMTAMLSRLFVGLLPANLASENDFIITSDSDLYPVNNNFYNTINNDALKVWNANCCGIFKHENKSYQMYPISYIGMRKWQWFDVMKLNHDNYKLNGKSIMKKISESFNKSVFIKPNNKINKGDPTWYLGMWSTCYE
jgi:hypothetical protein